MLVVINQGLTKLVILAQLFEAFFQAAYNVDRTISNDIFYLFPTVLFLFRINVVCPNSELCLSICWDVSEMGCRDLR